MVAPGHQVGGRCVVDDCNLGSDLHQALDRIRDDVDLGMGQRLESLGGLLNRP